jgi:hypothetical protein
MRFRLSPHAKKRIKERKVKKSEIAQALARPDRTTYGDRNRIIVNKKFNQKILEIVYVIENKGIIVITLYYL